MKEYNILLLILISIVCIYSIYEYLWIPLKETFQQFEEFQSQKLEHYQNKSVKKPDVETFSNINSPTEIEQDTYYTQSDIPNNYVPEQIKTGIQQSITGYNCGDYSEFISNNYNDQPISNYTTQNNAIFPNLTNDKKISTDISRPNIMWNRDNGLYSPIIHNPDDNTIKKT